jgi:hypothetical protein
MKCSIQPYIEARIVLRRPPKFMTLSESKIEMRYHNQWQWEMITT